MRDYLAVAQDRIHVEHWARQPGHRWLLTEYSDRTQSIAIPAIDCTLALSEVYDRVQY